ncbi:E3 ubiquitin-protein ligase RMA1H1 [Hibiscus syriacus]|uniref:E3 ubiquitin-protein ligase RMA1H1 n=1 Tax=Hibiscus syriacus TaxID=106335 RepID=A0A6A2Z4F8_HIBSY|nr:E3 ubiquitin-protein ligase RMA1H1 [Hibiscus syriacus]
MNSVTDSEYDTPLVSTATSVWTRCRIRWLLYVGPNSQRVNWQHSEEPSRSDLWRRTIRSPNMTDGFRFPRSLHHHGYSYEQQIYYTQQGGYPDSSMPSPGGTMISVPDPVTRLLGEMAYTRVFGNSMTDLYTNPNSYNLAGSTSRRIRRQLMQADKSLSRISFFLCCCIFFCLLLF